MRACVRAACVRACLCVVRSCVFVRLCACAHERVRACVRVRAFWGNRIMGHEM